MRNITDIPILEDSHDSLGIDTYKSALVEYIKNCETPMTISIQGEWGSGKTSLMNMLKHRVEFPYIWINTWEYSIVSEDSDIAISIVESIIDELILMISQKSDKFRDRVAKYKKDFKNIGGGVAKGIARLAFSIGAGVDNATGIDDISSIGGSITLKKMKSDLQNLVLRVVNEFHSSNSETDKKIVFFIDDLDRLPPETAVKILEVLKNIFDIKHCLFVLAIDYDVVIKGLKDKFGMQEENEREFRQFFDKIIQLPFSLPISNYNLNKFLSDILVDKIKYFKANEFESNYDYIQKVVNYSFGNNPRALKRVANYLSLISYINKEATQNVTLDMKLISFTLIAIQINYPFLYDMISKKSDFLNWEASDFDIKFVELRDEMVEKSEFDEEWEQQLLKAILSTKNRYFLEKSFDISLLLNLIKDTFGDKYLEYISQGLNISSITNVTQTSSHDTSTDLSHYWQKLHRDLAFINPNLKGKQNQKIDKWSLGMIINSKSSKIEISRAMQNTTWKKLVEYLNENNISGFTESLEQTKLNKKLSFLLDSGYKDFTPDSEEYINFFTQNYRVLNEIMEKFN